MRDVWWPQATSRSFVRPERGPLCPLAALAWSSPASAATLPVSISVDSSVNPSLFGQDVIYTATLTTSDSGSLDPGDGMEFQDNGNDIVNCNSQLLVATGARDLHGDL